MFKWIQRKNAEKLRKQGFTLMREQKWADAVEAYSAALAIQPDLRGARMGRAWARLKIGDAQQASEDARAVLEEIRPMAVRDRAIMLVTLGHSLHALGQKAEARLRFDAALSITPRYDWFLGRAVIRGEMGDRTGMIADLHAATRLKPQNTLLLAIIARRLATSTRDEERDGPSACEFATRLCELTQWKDWLALSIFAAALAECGRFEEAVFWASRSLEQAPENEKDKRRERLEQYRKGQPYRDDKTITLEAAVVTFK